LKKQYTNTDIYLSDDVSGSFTGRVSSLFRRIWLWGRRKYTIMFIPDSEKNVFNFQISQFGIVLTLLLFSGAIFSSLWFSASRTQQSRVMADTDSKLAFSEASLDLLRNEINELLQTSDNFQEVLAQAMDKLGIDLTGEYSDDTVAGDLSAFLGLEEVESDVVDEVNTLRSLNAELGSAVDPVRSVANLVQSQSELIEDIPTLWPLKGVHGHITNNFGMAINPFSGKWYLHRGLDIAVGYSGSPIVSTASGKVIKVEYDPKGFGNYILIRHKYGFSTQYAHLQSINVKKGQEVQRGQVVGLLGNTGLSTGPHLHYEVHIGSQLADPAKFLSITSKVYEQTARY